MKRISLLCLCAAMMSTGVPVRAIELSLEENRGERGSVGYVDMRRLFAASPDAARAREGLEELVRQAEERVNAKKAELLRLRQDLGTLKIEREELAKSTPTASVPAPPPAMPAAPAATPVPATPLSPTPAPVTAAPPAASTTAASAPLTINLPGLTDGPLNLEQPGSSPLNPTRDRGPVAPAPTPAPSDSPSPAPAPTPAPVPQPVPAGPTVAQRLLELDGRIVATQGNIDRLQGELDRERLGAEATLLDAEGRKTDQVLARLYRAISEVARREGVSVVVDKSATLYGHPAVDLTDKVLRQLRGVVPAQ
jgi:Skp family chaperone for outer membrane proteins